MNNRIFESILLCALFLLMGSCKKSPLYLRQQNRNLLCLLSVYIRWAQSMKIYNVP